MIQYPLTEPEKLAHGVVDKPVRSGLRGNTVKFIPGVVSRDQKSSVHMKIIGDYADSFSIIRQKIRAVVQIFGGVCGAVLENYSVPGYTKGKELLLYTESFADLLTASLPSGGDADSLGIFT